MDELEHAGFVEQQGPPPEAQRDFTKDGEQVQVAHLARKPHGRVVVAGRPAAGTPWPDDMLVYRDALAAVMNQPMR